MPEPLTHLGIDEAELQNLGGLWTAREIEQQPDMLRQTQALLFAQKAAIEAFLKPLLDR
jgi:tagatose-6-phosphate ketose/aldose isomerase